MHITHLGHACVVIEVDGKRILIDPGTLSTAANTVLPVDGLLVTHSHVDHLDPAAVAGLLGANASTAIVADADSARILSEAGASDATAIDSGSTVRLDVAGIPLEATTVEHAEIHCDLPSPRNNAYLVAESVLHPGDAFWSPARAVEVLLLPIGGPWMKLSESIEYLRSVAPRVAIPIHQGGLAPAHRALHCDLLRKLGPAETELRILEEGERTAV